MKRPEIQAVYLIGGTAVILKRFIEEYNATQARRLPIYFTDEHTSYWGLVEACEMFGYSWRMENGLYLPEEVESEIV